MNLKKINISSYIYNIISIVHNRNFKGWGRKKTGKFALLCKILFGGNFILQEDGFICSIGLRVDESPSFSFIEDDIGVYYDATAPSRLENILNNYNFTANKNLMDGARVAMVYMSEHNISKYNSSVLVDKKISKKYGLNRDQKRVLIIAQTAEDSSLKYGMFKKFSTEDIFDTVLCENPNAKIYLKIHPDVLNGKKKSDIDIKKVKKYCTIIDTDINSISLLKYFNKVYTKTSAMGFEALLVGCECVCFGMPFYAGWGITIDKSICSRRYVKHSIEEVFAAAYILYARYYDPYTKQKSNIFDTMKTIQKRRVVKEMKNAYFFGFSKWKQSFMYPFFHEYEAKNMHFINPLFSKHLQLALKKGLNSKADIYFWGRKSFPDIEKFAMQNSIKILHMEDGFIRSIGLGSNLTRPYSQVIDKRGIYFDPTRESDLEHYLNFYDFKTDKKLLQRAKKLQEQIVKNKISKYNIDITKKLNFTKQRVVAVVIGQVEDDASIYFGAKGMTNLSLLQKVKKNYPDHYLIFKPHPDVLNGNRIGNIEEKITLKYCDEIITGVSISDVLNAVDEVHTITSLVGLEGLLHGKRVYTYGMPFYAGWGLTIDMQKCKRRKRDIKLDELIASTYLLYPRYIDLETKELCEAEVVLKKLKKQKEALALSFLLRAKLKIYSYFSRISLKLYFLVG